MLCFRIIRGRGTPLDTGRKLIVHKTFRRRPGHLLNVMFTFNLHPVARGNILIFKESSAI